MLQKEAQEVFRAALRRRIGDVVRQPFVNDEFAVGNPFRQGAIVLDCVYRIAAGSPCETEYRLLPWNLYDDAATRSRPTIAAGAVGVAGD